MGKPSVRALIWGILRQWSLLECQNAHLQLGSKCSAAHHSIYLYSKPSSMESCGNKQQQLIMITTMSHCSTQYNYSIHIHNVIIAHSILPPLRTLHWFNRRCWPCRVIIGCVVSSWARLSLTFVSQLVFCTDHVSTKVSKGRFESIQNHTCGTFAQEFGLSS